MSIDRKRRPRRLAADEAHAWARNLTLKNPYAKLVLCMLTLYANGEGVCWVSLEALCEDTELFRSTVRQRLVFLEEVGAIVRSEQWLDEYGRRNAEGRGKRTTDEIRLMIGLDVLSIEARSRDAAASAPAAEAESEPDDDEIRGVPRRRLADTRGSASHTSGGALAVRQPSDSAHPLTSEPEPEPERESPPSPPPGDLKGADQDLEIAEPEHFPGFWQGYPEHEVMSRYRALEVFVTMTAAEQAHARAASPLLSVALEKYNKGNTTKRRPRDAHKWLAEKGWLEYPHAKLPSALAVAARRLIKGTELDAVRTAIRIASARPISIVNTSCEETGRQTDGAFFSRPIETDMLPLAQFHDPDAAEFIFVEEGSQQCASWRERLKAWLGLPDVEMSRKWLEDYDPAVHGLPGSDPNFKPRKFVKGLFVPKPWPPCKDGTWSPEQAA